MSEPRLRILFASPVWAPSRAFGGPVVAAGELVRRLVARGNEVDVVTTTIVDLHSRPALRSSIGIVDGATVRYLSTPLRYRWMGITPTLPAALARLKRPEVVHVFGFRDPVTTGVAAWCRVTRVPYVFEPLGMFEPRLRKVALKRALDATLYRGVARGAAAVVVASEREAETVVEAGVPAKKVRVRGNGFPEPFGSTANHDLRSRLGISPEAKVILYVGRIAAGKGIEQLLDATRELRDAHLERIKVPVLCLNGSRDALCRRDLMERVVDRLTGGWTMHWLEGADHSFRVLKTSGRSDEEVLGEIAEACGAWASGLGRGTTGGGSV